MAVLAGCQPPPEAPTPLEAQLARVEALHLPGFTALIEPPWVVVGNEPPAQVRQRAERSVRWATEALARRYGFGPPADPWTIWMFRDATTYQHFSWKMLGNTPTTPYGYANAEGRVLMMDISTGGGTMIHELVHPLLHAAMPDVPAWFNEGLASLYEQCGEDAAGGIRGELNWRLPGLQAAIEADTLPPLSWLLVQDHTTFYTEDSGTNYGQARYLLFYLQEQGLLEDLYAALQRELASDPTGAGALAAVLGVASVDAWEQAVWRPYVAGL